jgi:fructose-specific phosphotransferase system IIC component
VTETLKRDKETSPQSKRPISHWLLAIGGILLVAGGMIAKAESVYSEQHAASPTYFGAFFASVGGILFLIAILVCSAHRSAPQASRAGCPPVISRNKPCSRPPS